MLNIKGEILYYFSICAYTWGWAYKKIKRLSANALLYKTNGYYGGKYITNDVIYIYIHMAYD